MISGVAAIVLAFITWGYARTTKQMAKHSFDAAQAARDAAKSSQLAAELAATNTPVKFSVRPHSLVEGGKEFLGAIDLRCEAAAVYLRSATLESFGIRGASRMSSVHNRHTRRDWLPISLGPVDDTWDVWPVGHSTSASAPELPVRVFAGDSVLFLPVSGPRIEGTISSLEIRIEFTLTRDGEVMSRSVTGILGSDWK